MKAHMLNSIKTILKRKKISQRKLALLLGKSPTQVNKWLLGKNEIGVNTLVDIANVLNIGIDELLGRIIDESEVYGDLLSAKDAKALNLDMASMRMSIEDLKKEMAAVKADIREK